MQHARSLAAKGLLLLAIALFIPAPHSDAGQTYSIMPIGVLQIALFTVARLLDRKSGAAQENAFVLLEGVVFAGIVWIYYAALNTVQMSAALL